MTSRWRRISLLGRVYLLVGTLVALLATVAATTVESRSRADKAIADLTTVVVPAEVAVNGLVTAYSEQDDALHGFLLTHNLMFLSNYSDAQATSSRLEGIITQQLGDDPAMTRLLTELRQQTRQWRDHTMPPQTAQNNSAQPPQHAPQNAPRQPPRTPPYSLEGQRRFDTLRGTLADMHSRINEIATAKTAAADAARSSVNWIIGATTVIGVVLAAAVVLLLRRSLSRPLRTLVSEVDHVAADDLDRPVAEVGPPELTTVARAVETMRTRILTETRRATQMQQDLARHEEAERQRAERDFATVVAALDEGVIVVNTAGLIESANPAAERILGSSHTELIGSSPATWRLFDETGAALGPSEHLTMPTYHTGQPENSRVTRLDRADSTSVWLAVTSRVLDPSQGPPFMVVTSFTDITESRASRQRLEYDAVHDPLTGLANRTLVLHHLDPPEPSEHRPSPLAVLFVDLDNFKLINDSLGHGIGDDVLRTIGDRLNRAAPENSVVSRIGGDEFVVLAEHNDRDLLAHAGDRLLAALSEPIWLNGRQLHISGSIGMLVCARNDPRTGHELLRDADVAMYQAKSRGGGRCSFFDVELRERFQRRMSLEQDLRQAIPHDQLWIAYQPIIDLHTDEPVAAESLLRWNHPTHGAVSPGEFIPLAEESGLINSIGAYLLHMATRQFAAQRADNAHPPRLNANLSPRQLEDPRLRSTIENALDASGLPAHALCLEITESAIMREPSAAARVLNSLRELGVSLAIDDFGTGYSSMSQLRQLPLDTLKIDRSFITDLETSHALEVLVTTIISMAHALGLAVTAEGVETPRQLDILRDNGCDYVQGFHLGKPAPIDKVASAGGPQ